MAPYLGYDVLEREPAEPGKRTDEIRQRFELLDPGTGARAMFPIHTFASATRVLRWHMYGEADVKVYRDFVDARKGRLFPFWLPAMEYDFSLIDPLVTFLPTVRFSWIGYTAQVFPIGAPRRHLYFQNRATNVVFMRKAIASVDNGDGSETITLDSNPLGLSPSVALITFLRLSRLAEDMPEIHWVSRRYQYADLRITEIPKETPA